MSRILSLLFHPNYGIANTPIQISIYTVNSLCVTPRQN